MKLLNILQKAKSRRSLCDHAVKKQSHFHEDSYNIVLLMFVTMAMQISMIIVTSCLWAFQKMIY